MNFEQQTDFIASITQTLSEDLRDVPGLEDASAQDYYSAISDALGRSFTSEELANLSDGGLRHLCDACVTYFEIEGLPDDRLRAAIAHALSRWS